MNTDIYTRTEPGSNEVTALADGETVILAVDDIYVFSPPQEVYTFTE